jgi:hypothetical protein
MAFFKVTLWLHSNGIILNFYSFRSKTRINLSQLDQKKPVWTKKLLTKIEHVFAYYSRTWTEISKIPTDLDSAGNKHFSKITKNNDALINTSGNC